MKRLVEYVGTFALDGSLMVVLRALCCFVARASNGSEVVPQKLCCSRLFDGLSQRCLS